MKRLILPILLLATMLSSCVDMKKGKTESEAPDTLMLTTEEVITYDTLTLHDSRNIIENLEVPRYEIDMNVAFATGESPLAKSINELICEEIFNVQGVTPEEAMRHVADSIGNQFAQDLREFFEPDEEDASFRFTYEWSLEGIVNEKPHPKAQSYLYKIESYQGGAHGSHEVYHLNFDPKTGKRITRADVFKEDKNEELLALISQQLMKEYNCTSLEQLRDETSITLLGDLYVDENFSIEKDGICIDYNPYDIAPYAAGVISVLLSFEQLADIVTPDFKPSK